MDSKTVQTRHAPVRYLEGGQGEPLVLIPYLAADQACYAFQVADYAKHFTCISVDLRGAGLSDKPTSPYSTELFADDVAALRGRANIVVASFHWGLGREVLDYMRQIAHAAIDAGADIVMGHGPHHSLPVEVYKGRPIFYGLGSFSFHTGHGGRQHGVGEQLCLARAFVQGTEAVRIPSDQHPVARQKHQ